MKSIGMTLRCRIRRCAAVSRKSCVMRIPTDPTLSTMIAYMRAQRVPRRACMLPLFSANQPIALFGITSTELHEFTSEDYEVYRALTGQMSTVLQNRRLLEQTELALDETRRLYAASRSIADRCRLRCGLSGRCDPSGDCQHDCWAAFRFCWRSLRPRLMRPMSNYVHVWTRERAADVRTGEQIARDVLAFPETVRKTASR